MFVSLQLALSQSVCFFVLQEKLIQAIRRIQHEVELCREAERETYVESVDVEVLQFYAFESHRMIGV